MLLAEEACCADEEGRDKRMALMQAAMNGHTDTVQVLVELGADVNSIDGRGNTGAGRRGHARQIVREG